MGIISATAPHNTVLYSHSQRKGRTFRKSVISKVGQAEEDGGLREALREQRTTTTTTDTLCTARVAAGVDGSEILFSVNQPPSSSFAHPPPPHGRGGCAMCQVGGRGGLHIESEGSESSVVISLAILLCVYSLISLFSIFLCVSLLGCAHLLCFVGVVFIPREHISSRSCWCFEAKIEITICALFGFAQGLVKLDLCTATRRLLHWR